MADRKESEEERLNREGWVRNFSAKEPRLSEFSELYESLGFEVRLEPLRPDEIEGDCKVCFEDELEDYRTIYTRAKNKNAEEHM